MSSAVRYQVMPPLSSEEYQELHDDIKVNGVLEPIHVDEEGVVIDGHHRSKIANELGIPCPVITHDDLDDAGKRSLAFTLNLKRRHLNREQRRALIAESLKSDPQLSNREHERRTGTHKNTVQSVRKELESTGQIAQSNERLSGDGRVRPASQPNRDPEPSPAPGISSKEVDEINQLPTEQPTMEQPEPEAKAEPRKPRRTPITDDASRIGWEIRKIAEKLEALTEDDRYDTNKEKVTPLLRGHLQFVIETANTVLDDLTKEDK